ncbi:uncharacterized protein EV154DRAFT_548915 [Mucor mucedo]|uniref:uncharacterized protein n=1 Tax=Mucor mucedo TaxID=29922 RepID=UPI00221E9AE5|nr:uncharacterized protein EV154DRAFT_548915 [Mucor mucedo]KAI7894773.1 hypothetical protein EV154DRAFT_548915 [Mucor mucedo]
MCSWEIICSFFFLASCTTVLVDNSPFTLSNHLGFCIKKFSTIEQGITLLCYFQVVSNLTLLFPTKRHRFHPLTTNTFTILFSLRDSLPTYSLSLSDLSLATLLQSGLASIVIPASNTPVILASESIISVVFPHHSVRMSKILPMRICNLLVTVVVSWVPIYSLLGLSIFVLFLSPKCPHVFTH